MNVEHICRSLRGLTDEELIIVHGDLFAQLTIRPTTYKWLKEMKGFL